MASHQVSGLRAVIHARESRFEAKAGNRSTDEQVAESREWCDAEGVDVAHVIVEENTTGAAASRSTRAKPRAKWERTKKLLADGDDHGPIHILVTWSSTRGQRDLEEYVALRRLCVEAEVLWCYGGRVYDMTDGDDRFRTGVDALVGERDIEEIRRNVQRGLRANVAAGKPHGRVLYGYRRVYDDHTGAFVRQEPHPTEADVVRQIHDWYLAGHSPLTIAGRLNDDGVPTPTGKGRWYSGAVHQKLSNPAYIGRRMNRGEDAGGGCWPALVDDRTWERTQARLAARATPWDRPSPTKLLLTGLARCGVCMERMTRMPASPKRRVGYVCRNSHIWRNADRLDDHLTAALLERLGQLDVDEPSEDPTLSRAQARVAELKAELDAAMGAWKSHRLSVAAYTEMEGHLLPQIAEAERAARRALVPLDVDLPPVEQLPEWWVNDLTGEQRREYMAAYVAAVVVLPVGKGNRWYRDEDVNVIEWRR